MKALLNPLSNSGGTMSSVFISMASIINMIPITIWETPPIVSQNLRKHSGIHLQTNFIFNLLIYLYYFFPKNSIKIIIIKVFYFIFYIILLLIIAYTYYKLQDNYVYILSFIKIHKI